MDDHRMKIPRGTRVLALLLTLALVSPATNAKSTEDSLTAKIDGMMTARYPADGPGAAVIVVKDGETIFHEGYGMADLELGIAVESDMVFRIGSMTKQFTAVAILMLIEEGKISLDDPLEKFLPDYPTQGKTITVEHLLTHTSGIKSYTDQDVFMENMRKDYTPEEMIDRFKDEEMEFDPGESFNYNNSGYFLLGVVIEKTSGMSYEDFVQKQIFDVVGMQNTYFGRHASIIPRRARGYQPTESGWANADYLSMTQPYAAGAMLSTVEDLAKWDAALYTEALVGQESLQMAWKGYELSDGSPTGYGYGWGIGDWQGSPIIEHSGGINGFLSDGIRCPNEKVYVAILTNSLGAPPGPGFTAQRIATHVIGKPWEPKAIGVNEDVLRKYVGVYRIDDDTTRTVTFENGNLYTLRSGSSKLQVFPMSETEFFYEDSFSHLTIDLDESGAVKGMTMRSMSGPPEFAELTDEEPAEKEVVELGPNRLDNYLGRYELMPGFLIAITREGDQLWAQATGQPKFEIFAESKSVFYLKVVEAQIAFDLDDNGVATGLTLHQSGQHLPGKKLKD